MNSTNHHYNLPWLVNGRLHDEEKESLESALDESQELRDEKEYLSAMHQTIKNQALPAAPVEMGWSRLKRDIHQQKKVKRTDGWRVATIAASFLVVVQAAIITLPMVQQDMTLTPLSSQSIELSTLTVKFSSTATEAEIQALLLENNLQIIEGPSAIGLYVLSSNAAGRSEAYMVLSSQRIIEHVQMD